MRLPRKQKRGPHPIVMVIDDNPAIRDMVSWALELDGFEAEEAAEGEEALAWMESAAREGRYPAVVLLDLTMPGMGGQDFLDRLRTGWEFAHPLPALVVITAGTDDPIDAAKLGVDHIMIKPFHVRDLLDVVRDLAK